jgi:REP element-mobilizing transposase RayT
MRTRHHAREPERAYFVTSTVVQWLPVFTTAARCEILVTALEYCRAHKGLRISAWVVLDNHFHAILAAPDLPRVMADFKRHTARRLIELLESERCEWLLHALEYFRAKHKTESSHQLWQEGQAIVSDEMMVQKRDYLHQNP